MSITIIKPGLLATIQDAGISNRRALGIGSGGAMDGFAFAIANFLAGNIENTAAIEINFPAPEIKFNNDAWISIAGADLAATIDGIAVKPYTAVFIKKVALLKFNKPVSGSKAYIAVHGGWQASSWMNSYSTNIKLQTGGYNGRSLQKNDCINFKVMPFNAATTPVCKVPGIAAILQEQSQQVPTIRCVAGPEWHWLTHDAQHNFVQQLFTLNSQSDRMGYRFNSLQLQQVDNSSLISSAVDFGTIQLLPNGNIIVLMADHQTTGGYPRIGAVIKADINKLAQLTPGEKINFSIVSAEEAETELLRTTLRKQQIEQLCTAYFKTLHLND
jgi:antagonist of KipI